MSHVFAERAGDEAELEVLRPGDEFRIYDNFDEGLSLATYRFLRWKQGKWVCVALNLDTDEEVYVFEQSLSWDDPDYDDKKHIVMFESRALHRTKKAEQ